MNKLGVLDLVVKGGKAKQRRDFEQWMDSFEAKGMEQISLKYKRYESVYRQLNGHPTIDKTNRNTIRSISKMLKKDVSFVDEMNDRVIKNYDFMYMIADKIIQTMLEIEDKVEIESIDPQSKSAYLDKKTELFRESLMVNIKASLDELCVMRGISPIVPEDATEEERKKILGEIEKVKSDYDFDSTMNRLKDSYRDIAVLFAQKTKETDTERFRISDKIRTMLLDYLVSGNFFICTSIKQGYYEPDVWRQYETFHEAKKSETDPRKSTLIGRQRLLTCYEIIEDYGRRLSSKDKKTLLECVGYEYSSEKYTKMQGLLDAVANLNSTVVFGDDSQMRAINSNGGIVVEADDELGVQNLVDSGDHIDSMGNTNISAFGRQLVTECYYRTYCEIGYLKLTTPRGVVEAVVTKDVFKDILKDYDVEVINDKSTFDFNKNDYDNVIFWDYKEEVRWGVKIALPIATKTNSKNGFPNIYLGGEVIEVEFSGEGDVSGKLMPVSGGIGGTPLLKKIVNHQAIYDSLMDEAEKTMEKNQGLISIFNPEHFVDIFNGTDKETALNEYLDLIQEFGALASTFKQQPGGNSSPIDIFDASTTGKAMEIFKYASMIKAEAYSILEIPIQPVALKMEQNGIEQTNINTTTVLESVFDKFSEGMIRFWSNHIEVAKYAKSNNLDKYDTITQSIGDKTYLEDKDMLSIANAKLKIYPTTNASSRRKTKEMKMMLAQNTIQSPIEERFTYMMSDTPTKIMDTIQEIAEKRQIANRQQQEIDKMRSDDEHAKKMELIDREGSIKLDIERIKSATDIAEKQYLAMGFQKDEDKMKYIAEANKTQLNAVNKELDRVIASQRLAMDKAQQKYSRSAKDRELDLKEKAIEVREKASNNKLTESLVNKNKYDV